MRKTDWIPPGMKGVRGEGKGTRWDRKVLTWWRWPCSPRPADVCSRLSLERLWALEAHRQLTTTDVRQLQLRTDNYNH